MQEPVYRAKELCENTWVIYTPTTTCYLVCGDREGMMIDSGNTPVDLRSFAESVCGKTVRMVANTHGHFDHTGGNGYFKVAFMGRLAAEIAKLPNGAMDVSEFPLDYEIVIVGDGYKIDLGNREFECFVLDGHSPDSTAWLDKKGRILFTGDNISNAPLRYKCDTPQPSVLRYAMNLSKVMARRDEFDYILQGHNDHLVDGNVVNYTLICALRAADGELDEQPPRKPNPNAHKGPSPFKADPKNNGYVAYKDVHISFDKRYITDMYEIETAIGT